MPQRRAESPIRIQPRAAPWVKIFQQACALKEQKEGERVSTSLSPVALTARQLVNELVPRVLPWAVFPLGLRPAIAHTRGYCTLSLAISLLGHRPVFACNIAASHCIGLFPFQGLAPLLHVILAAARCHIYHYNLV